MLKVLAIVAALIAGVLLFAATKPDTFRIQRETTINASPELIFPLINDLHNWSRWEPEDVQNSLRRTFSGAESGEGAVSDWTGKGGQGQGRILITKSVPPTRVSIQADWVKPFKARNFNEFTLEPQGAATKVIWTMQGPNVYVLKVMSLFMNTDRYMGRHFEAGLANLKSFAEK